MCILYSLPASGHVSAIFPAEVIVIIRAAHLSVNGSTASHAPQVTGSCTENTVLSCSVITVHACVWPDIHSLYAAPAVV